MCLVQVCSTFLQRRIRRHRHRIRPDRRPRRRGPRDRSERHGHQAVRHLQYGQLQAALKARRSVKGDMPMSKFATRFLKVESGATAIEYGLIAALVAVVLVAALSAMGTKLSGTFDTVSTKLP